MSRLSSANVVKDIRRAFVDTLPIFAGYIVLGIGFGILLSLKGYGVLWSLLMSLAIYAGAMQYVAIDLLAAGASLLSAALATLMVNARHLFYGISMVRRYSGAGLKKLYMIHALTDETYSLVSNVSSSVEPECYHRYCFFVSLFDHCYWVSGCVLGNLLGPFIPFDTRGIDFALTALFVTICVDQWLNTKERRPACVGFASAIICLVLFGGKHFLIPSMLVIAAALTILRAKMQNE